MRFRTKQARLIAIADAWSRTHKGKSIVTKIVSAWAIANKLHPVPKRGDPIRNCRMWEDRLRWAIVKNTEMVP